MAFGVLELVAVATRTALQQHRITLIHAALTFSPLPPLPLRGEERGWKEGGQAEESFSRTAERINAS